MSWAKYGAAHTALRNQWAPLVAAGIVNCWRCHEPITAGSPWHLGHDDDRTKYRGPEHPACNLRAKRPNRTPKPTARRATESHPGLA
jgi:hypothetical protein